MTKQNMTALLMEALNAANLAGTQDTVGESLPYAWNGQDSLYGHLSDALSLVDPEIHSNYVERGDFGNYAMADATVVWNGVLSDA